jgi:outer membrane protein OmpA-like peptidoglycan-associated protein
MARARLLLRLLPMVAALQSGAAAAQTTTTAGFALDRFEPAPAGSRWLALDSVDVTDRWGFAAGLVYDAGVRPLVIRRAGEYFTSVVRQQHVMHLGGSVTALRRLRLALNVPLSLHTDGKTGAVDGVSVPRPTGGVAGDVRIDGDVRLLGRARGPFRLAVGAAIFAPSGSRAAYSSDGRVRVEPRLSAAGDVNRVAWAARVGFEYRGLEADVGGKRLGSEVRFGAAVGARVVGRLVIGPELYGSTVVTHGASLGTTPIEALLGVRYSFPAGLHLGIAGGAGLTRGLGAPQARGLLALSWAPDRSPKTRPGDRDGDGIPDGEDACPDQPGPRTADARTTGCPTPDLDELPVDVQRQRCLQFPDAQGCPDADRDGDGVPDAVDACPDQPGPRTADPKTSGCPVRDRDKDGVPDPEDACPDQPGPRTGDPKTNGCPVRDLDGDGIPDTEDACPDQPGPRRLDPRTNGCPDRDGDGIPDPLDACPDKPGPGDPDPLKNGCPKAMIVGQTIVILDQVRFATASARIVRGPESEEILQAVLKILLEHPALKVRVEGHTDDQGNAAANRRLSAQRAASVVRWLVGHGIAARRLSSAGLGQTRPLDSNATEAGRLKNRRVEFHIVAGASSQPAAAP